MDEQINIPEENKEVTAQEKKEEESIPQTAPANIANMDDFEVTAEGTANTGKGIKKVFFVKQKNPASQPASLPAKPVGIEDQMGGLFRSFSSKMGKLADALTSFDAPILNFRKPSDNEGLSPGDSVKADFLGMEARPGKIWYSREDGTYDVLYDHGAKEVRVPRKRISKVPAKLARDLGILENMASTPKGKGDITDEEARTASLDVPTSPTAWTDLPPSDPLEFEVFWDPAAGPLFFQLTKHSGGIVATKVDRSNEAVLNTRLVNGSFLNSITTENGTLWDDLAFEDVQEKIQCCDAPIGFRFREGPPIYREEKIEEATSQLSPIVHVSTFFPRIKNSEDQGPRLSSSSPFSFALAFQSSNPPVYEDIFEVSQRAMQHMDSFRNVGIKVSLMNMQTVTLPAPDAESREYSIFSGILQKTDRLTQAVRIWFKFDDLTTVNLKKTPEEVENKVPFGLVPVRTGEDNSFIIVKALKDSACERAGIPVTRILFLHTLMVLMYAPQTTVLSLPDVVLQT